FGFAGVRDEHRAELAFAEFLDVGLAAVGDLPDVLLEGRAVGALDQDARRVRLLDDGRHEAAVLEHAFEDCFIAHGSHPCTYRGRVTPAPIAAEWYHRNREVAGFLSPDSFGVPGGPRNGFRAEKAAAGFPRHHPLPFQVLARLPGDLRRD